MLNERKKHLALHFLGDRVAFKRNRAVDIENLPASHDSERDMNLARAAHVREEADALEEVMELVLRHEVTP